MIGFALFGSFKNGMFDKVGDSLFPLQFIARARINDNAAMCHLILYLFMDNPDAVF
jgi:hypothetical protein